MKTLPTEFTKKGLHYRQIKREGMVAMLEVTSSAPAGWEVVIVQTYPDGEVFGRKIEAGECMPASSKWGDLGWTFLPLDRAGADAKFRALVLRGEANGAFLSSGRVKVAEIDQNAS